MKLGIIVENKQILNQVISAHEETVKILFQHASELTPLKMTETIEAAARVQIDLFYISLFSVEDESAFIRSIKNFRIARPETCIVIIAVDRVVGDPLLAALVSMGVYDIIAPTTEGIDEDEELNLTHYIHHQLQQPATYATAARWSVQIEQTRTRRSIFPAKERDSEGNEQTQKPKEIVIYQDRILNSIIIAITGSKRRTGTTYTAIKTAMFLSGLGYKTACVEFMNEDFNVPVFNHMNSKEGSVLAPGGFSLEGVDFFPNVSLNQLLNLYAAGYKYIVIDFGCLNIHIEAELTQYEEEYIRSSFHIITAGSAVWDLDDIMFTLDRFYSLEWERKWHILFNFANEDTVKGFKDIFSRKDISNLKLAFAHLSFDPDMFSSVDSKLFSSLLEPILEKKPVKKRLFSFSR